MLHSEARDILRNRWQGKLCWQWEVGDHSDEHAPKNILSCWAIKGRKVVVIFLFEMSDRRGEEQGFEILHNIDESNKLSALWEAVDKLVS